VKNLLGTLMVEFRELSLSIKILNSGLKFPLLLSGEVRAGSVSLIILDYCDSFKPAEEEQFECNTYAAI
jgi:hypothetical protein